MSKELWRALPLAIGALLIGLVLGFPSGCSNTTVPSNGAAPAGSSVKQKPAAPTADAAKHPAAAQQPKPMLDGWAKPAVALVLSGDLHGYMEPCGCSITQSGGLSRRADFFRQMAEKGWSTAALDLGGLVRKDNRENKLKFQVMLSSLKDLGYKAIGLGRGELGLERLEPSFLLAQGSQLAAEGGPAFVSANVEFVQFKDAGIAAPSKIVMVGGHKIGVTSIFGSAEKNELFGSAGDPNLAVKDPVQVLPLAIAALKKEQAEVLVLLSQASHDESVALAKKFPDFQLVVTAGPEIGSEAPEHVGKTLLLEIGQKGKHVAVVGYYPDNKQQPFRFELVDLDKERFKDVPKMIGRLREYQQMLAAEYDAVLQDLPKSKHPHNDRFIGVETCKDCHKKAYAVWKDSKHAHAYETLITGREGTKDPVSRIHDPECLCCHVTGWEPQQIFPYESGFISAAKTPQLKGQQCENCHGPAARHVAMEEQWKKDPKAVKEADLKDRRHSLHVTLAEAKKTLCYRCHDLENDPNFTAESFPSYWDQVKHGKDD